MSAEETKSAAKPEVKPATKTETKPADSTESKPVGKAETKQAGKGSKRRPDASKHFATNYESIRWGKGHSRKPRR